MTLLFTFLWLIYVCDGHVADVSSCNSLPASGFLTTQQIDMICHHRSQWLKDRDEQASKGFLRETTAKQMEYLRDIEQCTRTNCVRNSIRKKRQSSKLLRKEIRMLSEEERKKLWAAMSGLKTRLVDNITAWDLHILVHYPDSAPGAHWGPAFLPWHREFLRQFEIALQREEPGVTLPYWDSTIDQGLPEPSDSVLWTDELLGNGNGYVKTGPFKDWDTNVFMPLSQIPVKKLFRSTGGREQDRLLSPRDVEWITSRNNYSQLTFCHDKTFESMHGLSHVWVGGFMFVIRVSPNDPMFYMHHAFVDYLWEQFRRHSQTREERETQWAKDTCNSLHGFDEQMKPFRIQNRDGLSNQYTDEWYDYEPVRHCSPSNEECDSPLYWCDSSIWRCRSKVVLGGNCTGYEGTQICYNSICKKNQCQLPPRVLRSRRLRKIENVPKGEYVWTKTAFIDQNGEGINDDLAQLEISNQLSGETKTVYRDGEIKYPEIPGILYVPLPKPRAGIVQNVTLEARDGHGRYCQAYCYNITSERYQVCQPILSIGYRSETSSPISYTHSITSRKYLDVDLSVHHRLITVSSPYMIFACSRKLVTSAMVESLGEKTRPRENRDPFIWFRVAVHRKINQNLQIEVVPSSGESWSSSIRRAASPFDPNLVFVQAPNPAVHKQGVRLHISVLEDGMRIKCQIKCTKKDGAVQECDGSLELHNDPARSEEDIFTSDQDALQLLGWNMRGHPTQWRHKMPYLTFYC